MDMEKIMAHVEKIVENLEGLVCAIGCDSMPSDGAIYVDGEQKVNYISTREALRILDGFGNNSASVMIGKSDYILIYDASRKLVIDGEAYLPSGYLVMKSCNGLQAIDDEDIADVIGALKSRMTMLALGKYRIQASHLPGVQTGAEPKGLQNDIAENYMKQATHQSVRFYHCRR